MVPVRRKRLWDDLIQLSLLCSRIAWRFGDCLERTSVYVLALGSLALGSCIPFDYSIVALGLPASFLAAQSGRFAGLARRRQLTPV
jgi:hypothetical protein